MREFAGFETCMSVLDVLSRSLLTHTLYLSLPPSLPSLSLSLSPLSLLLTAHNHLTCPKCRDVTVLSELGVDALPINWDLMVGVALLCRVTSWWAWSRSGH